MAKKASIYLVDDHPIVRNGLKILIEKMGYTITQQYDHGKELIDSFPLQDPPDLIIMDLTMPVMDGAETVRELKKLGVTVPVLMLTWETEEKIIIELFRTGIRGYLPKSSTADVIKKAIDDVLNTGYYHNEMLIKALTTEKKDVKDEKEQVAAQLTDREKQFLQLVCNENELTYEQIADQMGVSRRTVDGYREAIFEKFNIKSKTGLVLFAIKYGLINVVRAQ